MHDGASDRDDYNDRDGYNDWLAPVIANSHNHLRPHLEAVDPPVDGVSATSPVDGGSATSPVDCVSGTPATEPAGASPSGQLRFEPTLPPLDSTPAGTIEPTGARTDSLPDAKKTQPAFLAEPPTATAPTSHRSHITDAFDPSEIAEQPHTRQPAFLLDLTGLEARPTPEKPGPEDTPADDGVRIDLRDDRTDDGPPTEELDRLPVVRSGTEGVGTSGASLMHPPGFLSARADSVESFDFEDGNDAGPLPGVSAMPTVPYAPSEPKLSIGQALIRKIGRRR